MKTYPPRRESITQNTRERILRWEDPFVGMALAQRLSGLEALSAVLAGTLPPPPMVILMNFRLVDVSEGRVVLEGDPGEEHHNLSGVVHGGYALTMLDTALACAIQSMLPAGATYGTIDVHARLLRPITKDTGTARCEAHLVSATRTLASSEARITDTNGRLLATATTACALRRALE